MLKPGSRFGGAMFAVTGLLIADARLALAQDQTQEGIQEVVVTAERRVENLQKTPIAITAMSADQLNKQGVVDFAGVANASTSLNFTPYPSSSNTLILYMRGQGVADANQITQDGSVGLYEDGFYIARPQAETFDLADVDRVEILRGPQGTLYGRNTTGGAVNIISKKPTGDLDFKFSVDGGTRQYVRALGTIDLPKVAGGLSSKVTLLYSNLEGNVHNEGGEDYNKEAQKGARFAARWDTGGMFTADYFWELGQIDSTPIYYQDSALSGIVPGYPPNNSLVHQTWEPIPLPLSTAKFNGDGLTLSFKLNDSTVFKSLTGYRGLDSRFGQDYASAFTDPQTAAIQGLGPPNFNTFTQVGPLGFASSDVVQSNQITQEFQLVGSIGSRFNYVGGLYYFEENANHAETVSVTGNTAAQVFAPPTPLFILPLSSVTPRYVKAQAKSRAAYFQGTYQITDPLSLTLGGRYTKDDRSAEREISTALSVGGTPIPLPSETFATAHNSLSFSKFNPAGTLNMAWTPDVNTYLRIATGYKAGGSSEAGPVGGFGLTFKPENVTTYELGLKSYWLEHRLRANVAVFHSDFKDMQLQFNVDPTNLAVVQGYNAGQAKVDGAEIELLFAPTNDLTLGLNYSYLNTKFDTVTAIPGTTFDPLYNPLSPYKVGDNVAAVFRLPYAPKNIATANLDWTMLHTHAGSLELALDYRFQDRQFDTATTGSAVPGSEQYYSIGPYGIMNGKLSWNFNVQNNKTLRVSLWAKNILDKQYPVHVIGQGAVIPTCTPNGSGQTGLAGCYTGAAISPVAGYTYQAIAWAAEPMYGAQIQYGF